MKRAEFIYKIETIFLEGRNKGIHFVTQKLLTNTDKFKSRLNMSVHIYSSTFW